MPTKDNLNKGGGMGDKREKEEEEEERNKVDEPFFVKGVVRF